jgi:hypothetical protein
MACRCGSASTRSRRSWSGSASRHHAILLTGLLWPVRWLVRRKFGATLALERRELIGYRLVRTAAWLILLALLGWAIVMSMLGDLQRMSSALDPILYTVQIFTFIAVLGGIVVAAWDLWLVWRGKRRWTAKLWSVVFLLAVLIVFWVCWSFNLLSLGANY